MPHISRMRLLAKIAEQFYKGGLTDIIDVVEGVSGSRIGIGWIRRDLPMRRASRSTEGQ